MPLAARQKATKASNVLPSAGQLSSTPAAPGAANTSTFFTHCCGRAVRSRPRPTDTRPEQGPGTPATRRTMLAGRPPQRRRRTAWRTDRAPSRRHDGVSGRPRSRASSWPPPRDRPPRCRARRWRARRTPSPAGGRGGSPASAPWRRSAGLDVQPVGLDTDRAPVLASSAARSPRRSLSLARMNPTPLIVVGDAAVAATAARVGTRSEMSPMSTSMPRSGVDGSRATAIPARSSATVQPMRASRSANDRVALDRALPQAADLHPPAGDRGHRQRVAGRRGIGLDVERGAPVAAGGHDDRSPRRPRRRRRRTRPSPPPSARRTGADTSGVVSRSRSPPSSSGAISISAVRYWLDTSPGERHVAAPSSGPVTVTGSRPGALAAATSAPSAARASCSGPIGRRRSGGAPSMVTGPAAEGGEGGDEARRRPGQAGVERDVRRVEAAAGAGDDGVVARRAATPMPSAPQAARPWPRCRRRRARRAAGCRRRRARRTRAPGWRCSSSPGRRRRRRAGAPPGQAQDLGHRLSSAG